MTRQDSFGIYFYSVHDGLSVACCPGTHQRVEHACVLLDMPVVASPKFFRGAFLEGVQHQQAKVLGLHQDSGHAIR